MYFIELETITTFKSVARLSPSLLPNNRGFAVQDRITGHQLMLQSSMSESHTFRDIGFG